MAKGLIYPAALSDCWGSPLREREARGVADSLFGTAFATPQPNLRLPPLKLTLMGAGGEGKPEANPKFYWERIVPMGFTLPGSTNLAI